MSQHITLPDVILTVTGTTVVTEPNPAYRWDEFHCRADGCACIHHV